MREPEIIRATKRFEIEEPRAPYVPVHERSEEDTPENRAYCNGCTLHDCMYDTLELCKKHNREMPTKVGRKATVIPDFEKHYQRYVSGEINKTRLANELGILRPTLDRVIKRYILEKGK